MIGKSVGEMKKYVFEGFLELIKVIVMLIKGIEEGIIGMVGNIVKMVGLVKIVGNIISGLFVNMKIVVVKSFVNIVENLKGLII